MSECVMLAEGFCACHGPGSMQFEVNGKIFNSLRVDGLSFQNVSLRNGDGVVLSDLNMLILMDNSDNTACHVPLTPEIMREIAASLLGRANQLEPKSGLN